MNRAWKSAASAILLLGAATGVARAQAHFTGRMDGAQETPSVATAARGTVAATLTSLGLHFFITVEGLSGPMNAAHIHSGAPGIAGPVVRSVLAEFAGTTSAAGVWTASDASPLTPALIADLMAGNLYLNVHTAAHLAGEMRAQLRLDAGAHFTANLQGAQENPATGATGTGTGSFTLTEQGLHYKLTLNGLSGAIAAAHIHTGAIGVGGPVTFDIMGSFTGNSATGFISGLTPTQKRDLIAGNLYVNVHTAANPAGELRGQIQSAGGIALGGGMDAGQVVPPGASTARGTVSATLTPLGLLVDFSTNGLTGAISAAQLRNATAGATGPVVRTVAPAEFSSPNSATLLWRSDDGEPLTPARMSELLKGNLYLNVATAANPGGEIRAQLVPALPTATPTASFTANITGAQERPSVAVGALGTGNFVLTPAGLAFRVTVEGLSGAISVAHFHSGAIGVGGGVVRAVAAGEFVSPTSMAGVWAPGDASPLTAALITELIRGNLYFNVHTAAHPAGEMRGQIVPASGAEFDVRLTGAQETPATGAAGIGTGSLTLTQHGLLFNATFDGLTGAISAGHVHSGAPGVPGGVVRAIAAGEFVTANTLAGVWKPADANPLTAALVTELLKGNLYMNVHTAAFPAGELRGQITLAGGLGRDVRLSGTSEIPPVDTPARGTASLTLTDQGVVFRMSANELQGTLDGAHFHEGPVDDIGPTVRNILPEFVQLTADGVWKPTDSGPLTGALMGSLVRGNIYNNLHTTVWPGGEIRGQAGTTSALAVEPKPSSPAGIVLKSPANPVTRDGVVDFFLPRASQMRLGLYDVTGARVATLAEGPAGAGWHTVPFDARSLRTGMYFIRLATANGEAASTKILVMR